MQQDSNSPPPSLLMTLGTPYIKHNCSRWRATSSACFEGSGKAKGDLEALSTTSNRYLFLLRLSVPTLMRSIITSQGSMDFPGSIATLWLLERVLIRQLHDSTYSLTSRAIIGQKNLSRTRMRVAATPGWPCIAWTSDKSSGTVTRGTAKLAVA